VADLDGYEEPIRVAAAVIAVSDFVKKQALRKSVPFGHIECVWNGVDTGWFKPQVFDKSLMRKEFGIEAEAKVVLLVARFEPRKRHDLLLRAATQIRNSVRGLQLVIVGDPAEARNYTEALHDQIREDGLAETTKILPFQQDIRRIECAADVLVVPSDREPLARCLIEAMAIGLPVVINDSGGDSEVVEDGVTGCIVPHGDPQALADCVSRVLNESDFRDKIAKAARRFAEEHLDIRRHVQEVCRIYERVMSSDMLHSQLPRFRGRAMDETWHDTSSTPPFRER
jgi:glycosyltransferase involved in cell wall biosynthesis